MPKAKDVLLCHISDIDPVYTSHGIGEKRVIATQDNVGAPITQIARTKLLAGDMVRVHLHPTMDEHFFILDGVCDVNIEGAHYSCKEGDYLYVPANLNHEISVLKDITMITIGVAY